MARFRELCSGMSQVRWQFDSLLTPRFDNERTFSLNAEMQREREIEGFIKVSHNCKPRLASRGEEREPGNSCDNSCHLPIVVWCGVSSWSRTVSDVASSGNMLSDTLKRDHSLNANANAYVSSRWILLEMARGTAVPGGRGVCEAQCYSIEENENGRVESDDSTCGGSARDREGRGQLSRSCTTVPNAACTSRALGSKKENDMSRVWKNVAVCCMLRTELFQYSFTPCDDGPGSRYCIDIYQYLIAVLGKVDLHHHRVGVLDLG
ncbi:hypothetical protein EDD15DRAFT_2190953 [Pisolithus albus]|nr:hypothetical protein EDD15DRAFT_2190953 [Pisolithus albus]